MKPVIVEVRNMQRMISDITIIKRVNAEVKPGDVIALLGKNGAGKTTLLETLLGFAFPSFGDVCIWGEKATEIAGDIKQRIGFVPQQDELLAGFNGHEHINLFKAFRKTWNQELVDRLVTEWLIPMDVAARKMSVGQRQKLSILLAIAHEPDLLILDEPVASLDPIARRQFLQQLVDIAADENRAIIFSSHIVADMERVANQVWMLQNGELTYQGGLDELKESIARLTINATEELPANLGLSGAIKQRAQGKQAWVTLKNWTPDQQEQIAKKLNADVQVDYLSLEDIFLEMNA